MAKENDKEKQQSNSGEQNSSDVISLKLDYYDLFHVLKQLQRDDISVRQAFQIITGVKYKTPKTNNHE
jgi:flagellar biosynthesis component FlhA